VSAMVFLPIARCCCGMLARQRHENYDYFPIIQTGLAPNILLADIPGSSQITTAGPQSVIARRPGAPAEQQHQTVRRVRHFRAAAG
jgi:hypothetical protein